MTSQMVLHLKGSDRTNWATSWSCPFNLTFLYNNPSFIIKSLQYFNSTLIPEGSPSHAVYCKCGLSSTNAITGPMLRSALCSHCQSCFESLVDPSITKFLITTGTTISGTVGIEQSTVHPLLIMALTRTKSQICNVPSCSQGIWESTSVLTFYLLLW